MSQLVLALFIIGIGISVAGVGTHLYQCISRQVAEFRISGQTIFEGLMNLFVTFICGPYLMLRLGMRAETNGRLSPVNMLLASFIAFSWSFVTGLMILGTYVSMLKAGVFA